MPRNAAGLFAGLAKVSWQNVRLTIALSTLTISLSIACLPASAQIAMDADPSEVNGLSSSNKQTVQGFNVGQYAATGGTAITIKKDALPQVGWYKSRRQVSIEDDGPVVSHMGVGGGERGLTPAGFGSNMGGAPRYNTHLQQANFGAMVRPELPPARPMMHNRQGAAQSAPAVASALPIAPARAMAAPATYSGGYGAGKPVVTAASDFEAARVRDVKARLLGR